MKSTSSYLCGDLMSLIGLSLAIKYCDGSGSGEKAVQSYNSEVG